MCATVVFIYDVGEQSFLPTKANSVPESWRVKADVSGVNFEQLSKIFRLEALEICRDYSVSNGLG